MRVDGHSVHGDWRCSVALALLCALFAPIRADEPPGGESADTAKIDAILTRVESARNGLTDLRCGVRYVEDDRINYVKRVKFGHISMLMAQPNPLFMVYFERTEVDGMVGKREWYLFDGRWLFEAMERVAQVTKREIAGEGERLDFFDIEKAPFPLPFGQKKETMRRNFDISLAPAQSGDPPDSEHLVCIPKAGSALKTKYDRLDIWVLPGIDMPGRVVVSRENGQEIKTADFLDLTSRSINVGLSAKEFVPQPEWKSYKEVVETRPPE